MYEGCFSEIEQDMEELRIVLRNEEKCAWLLCDDKSPQQ